MLDPVPRGWFAARACLSRGVLGVAFLTSLVLCIGRAHAQQISRCAARADMVEYLAKTYGEQPVAIGLTRNGVLMEILAHPDGRSWSLISTALQGGVRVSCLQLAGEAFRTIPMRSETTRDPES